MALDEKQMKIETLVKYWKEGPFDQQTKDAIAAMSPMEIEEIFGSELLFGTGGIRAIMGAGPSRMNLYTIRRISLGVVKWVLAQKDANKSIVIGHDSRNGSVQFMQEVARVCAAFGVTALYFPYPAATPAVSFMVQHLKAGAGVMITASHNPKEYNGYKVYCSAGYQVLDEDAEMIAKFIAEANDYATLQVPHFATNPLIQKISDEDDLTYVKRANLAWNQKIPSYSKTNQPHVLFTPLHGVAQRYFARQAAAASYTKVESVPLQAEPDGNFPTVIFANPEEPKAFDCAIEQIRSGKSKARYIIATDPDADRMGAVFLEENGNTFIPNGNEIATMLLAHTIRSVREFQVSLKNPTVVKSVVTTPALDAICRAEGIPLVRVLPGFKYIGQKMDQWSRGSDIRDLLLGAEESYGYLVGQHSRDKDGIIASVLMMDLLSRTMAEGISPRQYLYQIYLKYGLHRSKTFSLNLPKDLNERKAVAERLKKFFDNPPSMILGEKVISYEDFRKQKIFTKDNGKMREDGNNQPVADILQYSTQECTITLRPSGTEPKLKLYVALSRHVANLEEIPTLIEAIDKKIEAASTEVKTLMQL
jgi:phosphomannomutase